MRQFRLSSQEQRLAAEIYVKQRDPFPDTTPELMMTRIEERSNEEKPSDGEIYYKIRQYERERNLCLKNRWKARLSNHRQRNLQQLIDHEHVAAAFDDILDVPGFWDGMRISTLHKMLGIKCDEEILHYLRHIKGVWSKLLRGDKTALQRVDSFTVRALELKAPGYSKRDAQALQGQLLSGQIFSAFSQQERDAIWSELRSIDCLIPSLFTFFEDLKYLQACADSVKRLVKLSPRDTVLTAMEHKFTRATQTSDHYGLEGAESTFAAKPGPAVDRFDLAYRQLWLYAMRHFREMPAERKKRKDLLAMAGWGKADETVLHEFAALADQLGFVSEEINDLTKWSSDREIARSALLKARKPDRYEYDDAFFEAHVRQIAGIFSAATPLPLEQLSPALVSDDPDASGNRCGLPGEDAHEQDCKLLSMAALHAERDKQGEGITSFFVRRSVYFAFFGKPQDVGAGGGYPVSRPPHARAQHAESSSPQEVEMRSTVNASTAICKVGTGSKRAAGEATPVGQSSGKRQRISHEELWMPTQQFATQGASTMEEETLFVAEMPIAADGNRKSRDQDGELDDRGNDDGSATSDETRSNVQTFEDAVSYQISDGDNSSIDIIRAEKQEDGRTYYLIPGTVMLKMSPRGSRRKTTWPGEI